MKSIGLVPELYCSNLNKTVAFYVGILDFTILYQRDEDKFTYLQKGNAKMMFEEIGIQPVCRTRIGEMKKGDRPNGRRPFSIQLKYILTKWRNQ